MYKQSAILNIYKHSVCKCDRRRICSQLLGFMHTFSLLALHQGSVFSALVLSSLSINNRFPAPQPPTPSYSRNKCTTFLALYALSLCSAPEHTKGGTEQAWDRPHTRLSHSSSFLLLYMPPMTHDQELPSSLALHHVLESRRLAAGEVPACPKALLWHFLPHCPQHHCWIPSWPSQ